MGSCQDHHPIRIFLFFGFSFLLLFPIPSASQGTAQPAPQASPLSPKDACIGVYLEYTYKEEKVISPRFPNNSSKQPVGFSATAVVLNNDDVPLELWSLHLDYPNGTVIVSASNVVSTDGSSFPYIIGQSGSTGISFSGSPNTDLKTAIETAGDITQIQAQIDITGTRFGDFPTAPKLPTVLKLDNPEFNCPPAVSSQAVPTTMQTCCLRVAKPNDTRPISEPLHPRQTGDLSISYDVIQSFPSNYLALVKIEENPSNTSFGRLDNWNLTWSWTRGEFIMKTQGAYTTRVNPSQCLFSRQGQFYEDLDFSTVQNCDEHPSFVDLPLSMTNDTKLGMIPFCCRNGTLLPAVMDISRSASAFQLQVFKMPPDLNRTSLFPPQNFQISGSNGAINPSYKCSPPVRVVPTLFPDPAGLPTSSSAVASWQVICNISRQANANPRCCVTFSGFYNESVIPCKTCACGCSSNVGKICSTSSPAMLLPSEALLVPFDNRTAKALAWAEIKHFNVPNPMPCGDFCGVTINWHVLTDFNSGWSVRMTLFNWGDVDIPDWFAAVEMDKAYDEFEDMYSFDGIKVGNNTLFMQGLPGLNYLVKMDRGQNPMVPGKLQSVISFTKKLTPRIDVVAGGGFPKKVFFNGEECSVPDFFPSNDGFKRSSITGGRSLLSFGLILVVSILMLTAP